jgi:hypothetical protein
MHRTIVHAIEAASSLSLSSRTSALAPPPMALSAPLLCFCFVCVCLGSEHARHAQLRRRPRPY